MSSRNLQKLLAELGAQTRESEAPKHVEAALLSAFRAQSHRPVARMWTRLAVAAAAAIVVVIAAGVWKLDQPVDALPPLKLAAAPRPPLVQPAPAQTAPPVVAKRARRPARRRTVPAPVEEPPSAEVATDFMPLEDTLTLPPLESGHVLRVEMPRSTMMRFGVPVHPDRMLEPVKADVVFGQDGIARAVRFVK